MDMIFVKSGANNYLKYIAHQIYTLTCPSRFDHLHLSVLAQHQFSYYPYRNHVSLTRLVLQTRQFSQLRPTQQQLEEALDYNRKHWSSTRPLLSRSEKQAQFQFPPGMGPDTPPEDIAAGKQDILHELRYQLYVRSSYYTYNKKDIWIAYRFIRVDQSLMKQLSRQDVHALVGAFSGPERDSKGQVHLHTAIRIMKDAHAVGYEYDSEDYNLMILLYSKISSLEKATEMFQKMKQIGFTPSNESYSELVDLACRRLNTQTALMFFQDFGGEPNEYMYADLIVSFLRLYCASNNKSDFDMALKVCKEAIQGDIVVQQGMVMEDPYEQLDYCTYHLLRRMLEINSIQKAKRMLESRILLGFSLRDTLVQFTDTAIGNYLFEEVRQVLHFMLKTGDHENARLIYDKLLKVMSRSDRIADALLLYQQMNKLNIRPNYTTAVRFFKLLSWDYRFAEDSLNLYNDIKYWARTEGRALEIDLTSIEQLFRSLVEKHMLKEAKQIYDVITSLTSKPSAATYETLLLMCTRVGNIALAERTVKDMLAAGLPINHGKLTTLMDGYVNAHDMDGAVRIMSTIITVRIKPDIADFNVLLRGFAVTSLEHVSAILREMKNLKISPDAVTYATLFQTYTKARDFERANKILKIWGEAELIFNTRTLNVLLKTRIRDQGIEPIIKSFLKETWPATAKPDEYTYEILLSAGYRRPQRIELLEILFGHAIKAGIKLTRQMFLYLIKGWLRAENPTRAWEWVGMMENRDLKPHRHTYGLFAKYFAMKMDTENAWKYVQLCRAHKLRPDKYTTKLLMNAFEKAGFKRGLRAIENDIIQYNLASFDSYIKPKQK